MGQEDRDDSKDGSENLFQRRGPGPSGMTIGEMMEASSDKNHPRHKEAASKLKKLAEDMPRAIGSLNNVSMVRDPYYDPAIRGIQAQSSVAAQFQQSYERSKKAIDESYRERAEHQQWVDQVAEDSRDALNAMAASFKRLDDQSKKANWQAWATIVIAALTLGATVYFGLATP